MSRRNSDYGVAPKAVLEVAKALETKIGRPAYVRQAKNREEWIITDPMFSFVQRGLKKGATDYRVGYLFSNSDKFGKGRLYFFLVHSPIMAHLFKKNLRLPSLIHAVSATASFRTTFSLWYSSCSAIREGYKGQLIEEKTLDDFLTTLRDIDDKYGFVNDLFSRIKPQRTGYGHLKSVGNDFYLLLAEKVSTLHQKEIVSVVEASWPLFLCLYPVEAIEQRSTNLARNLKTVKLPKICEYVRIKSIPKKTEISLLCRGEIEGAHIKPDALGGTDRLENGLWLCQYHHRAAEGKLSGSRTDKTFDVRYVSK